MLSDPAGAGEELALRALPEPIRVDAHLSDWPEARHLRLREESQVVEGRALWGGAETLSADLFLAHDALGLHLAAVVRQRHPPSAGEEAPAEGDSLEILVSFAPAGETPAFPGRLETHLLFAPGKGAREPLAWCLSRDRGVPGARCVARRTPTGWILEASVPWEFFPGAEVVPGRTFRLDVALNGGGGLGGGRRIRLSLSGLRDAWKDPRAWRAFRFEGEVRAFVPDYQADHPVARFLEDGTKGAILLRRGSLAGRVADSSGAPLAGARVWTWPASKMTSSGGDGRFRLEDVLLYDETLLLARRPDTWTVVAPADQAVLQPLARPAGVFRLERGPWEGITFHPDRPEAFEREAGHPLQRRPAGAAGIILSYDGETEVKPLAAYLDAARRVFLEWKRAHPALPVLVAWDPRDEGMEPYVLFLRYNGDACDGIVVPYPEEENSAFGRSAAKLRAWRNRAFWEAPLPPPLWVRVNAGEGSIGDLAAAFLDAAEAGFAGAFPLAPPPHRLAFLEEAAEALAGEPLPAESRRPDLALGAFRREGGGTAVLAASRRKEGRIRTALALWDGTVHPMVDAGLERTGVLEIPAGGAVLLWAEKDGGVEGVLYDREGRPAKRISNSEF